MNGLYKLLVLIVVLIGCKATNELRNDDTRAFPNVILVMTDDQGIGDLSSHGNPYLKTPNLDSFYNESVRMINFHVSPYCTPTRAALMTGRYPLNNGTWATYKGRDAIAENNVTIADVFKHNGYKTGLFGKWHLGDNYPVRPTDSGFDVAIHHMAGGVGELSDYWGNNYFDDVYSVNNEPAQFEGYCTDVWFEEAMKFIKGTKDQPFFLYLPTNAPHAPLIVDEKYASPYRALEGNSIQSASYLGMIANIDENFGKLDQFLKDNNLRENTILIFMTDNGTQYGYSKDGKLGYNKGFRGNKGGRLEGAHRVPYMMRWPASGIDGGKDIDELLAHVDLLPTLIGLCELEDPYDHDIDGVDFSNLLTGENYMHEDRSVYIHLRQDWRPPSDLKGSSIMKNQWRLINGDELYDIEQDRMQLNNIASSHPQIVQEIVEENGQFVSAAKLNQEYQELPVHVVGHPDQLEITLTIQHAIGEDGGIWQPEQVSSGMKNTNNTHALRIDREGKYRISFRRWPKECPGPIHGIPKKNPKDQYEYQNILPSKARLQIANQILEKEINSSDQEVVFEVFLEEGKTMLVNDFFEEDQIYGVYYTYIEYLESTPI